MHTPWLGRTTALVLLAVACSGAGTEAREQQSRRTPIVEAVEKTRNAIVTIQVEKREGWGHKEMVGTGVIVDERGYVVTNRHVVAAGDRLTVRLADGTELSGRVLHEDARHDLAIVRVQSLRPLQALPLGPGGDLLVGETVIAIGHPYGYSNTVTTGIISYVGREITLPGGEVLGNLIQTDASINPGNSGGPLLNINGELIGINVALREGAQGIAFALNADTVQQVLSKQLSAVKVAGVEHGLVCRETTLAPEGETRQHVVIERLAEQGPAVHAGLKPGDILLEVAGRSVSNRFDLERALWDHKVGETVEATILREGKQTVVALKLSNGVPTETVANERPTASRTTARIMPAAAP